MSRVVFLLTVYLSAFSSAPSLSLCSSLLHVCCAFKVSERSPITDCRFGSSHAHEMSASSIALAQFLPTFLIGFSGLGFATRSSAMGTSVLGLAVSLCPACASFLSRFCSARTVLHDMHNTCSLLHHRKLPRSSKDRFHDIMRHRGESIQQQVAMFQLLPSLPPDAFLASLRHKRRSRETCGQQTHTRWTREPFTRPVSASMADMMESTKQPSIEVSRRIPQWRRQRCVTVFASVPPPG